MSGGIDSSVAAALLQKRGLEVLGVYMKLFPSSFSKENDFSAQKSAEAASCLGIEHFVVDLSQKFKSQIIDYFVKEYARGYTTNPCVKCNPYIKFNALLEESRRIGAHYIATGHYVRIVRRPKSSEYYIKRGLDKRKDQSYFLYLLSQKHIKQALMPLGERKKEQVKKQALKFNFPTAHRHESQEVCFIPDNDYINFIKKKSLQGFIQGPILDSQGNTLGKHHGYARFTIGQRRGLGIAASQPLYVLDINPRTNEVIVGPEKKLYKKSLTASKIHWISGQTLESSLRVLAQIRYNHKPQEAMIRPKDSGMVEVIFKEPQRAITPGQSVVFYDGEKLLGGGTIIRNKTLDET